MTAKTARVLSALARLARGRLAAQSAVFAAANVLAILLGSVTTAVVARSLSTTEFGTLAFGISLLAFVALFFEFGLFLAAGRLLARSSDRETRRVLGAALLAYVPMGAAFSAVIFALSYPSDQVFHVDVGPSLRAVAPIAFAFPFLLVAMLLAQGAGRLHVYSLGALLTQVLFLAAVVSASALSALGVTRVLTLRALAVAASSAAVTWWLRPRFQGAAALVPRLVNDARRFGFQVYVGRVLGTGTYNMDVFMLAGWANAKTVGFYALAGALAAAGGLPVQGMASALFKRMANHARVEGRWLAAAWCVGLASAAVTVVAATPLIRVGLSARYAPAAALVLPLALAQVIRGVTAIYNWFLAAQGHGRPLRNAAVVLTTSNLLLNFALIPKFGAAGAAWASFIALLANLIAHMVAYRRVRTGVSTTDDILGAAVD